MSTLRFSKMHGLGNDFVLISAIDQRVSLTPLQIQALANRHTGIGFDQLLLVERAPNDSVDFGYRIFNADGSEAEQCGNGARCFAQFVRREQLTSLQEIRVQTATTVMQLKVLDDCQVSVSMGAPRFIEPPHALDIPYPYTLLDLGNPHCVLQVSAHNDEEIKEIGVRLQSDLAFPNGVNVGFMVQEAPDHIRLRVFERGAGETLACGSGACAAVVAGLAKGQLSSPTQVDLPGGRCEVSWAQGDEPIWLTGPTAWVFEGEVRI